VSDDGAPLVLVADDDEDILGLVSFRLERSGYEVAAAKDGEEALRLARKLSPALVVLDVMMPRLDGYEVTRRLREDEATRGIPVILLTALAQEGGRGARVRVRRGRLPPEAVQPAGARGARAGSPRPALMLDAIAEPLGYRQLNELWRTVALWDLLRRKRGWGEQRRRGFAVR
jgi:CheY-like chemotaxis protein